MNDRILVQAFYSSQCPEHVRFFYTMRPHTRPQKRYLLAVHVTT